MNRKSLFAFINESKVNSQTVCKTEVLSKELDDSILYSTQEYSCLTQNAQESSKNGMTVCSNLNSLEYVVGCDDGSFHLRDKSNHKVLLKKNLTKEHKYWIWAMLNLEDKLVTGSDDCTIKVWGLGGTNRKSLNTLYHGGCVFTLIHIKGLIIASGGEGDYSIKLWNINCSYSLYSLKSHTNCVWGLQIYDYKTLLSVSTDKSIRLWAIQNETLKGKPLKCIIASRSMVSSLRLTQSIVAFGTIGPIDIWNIQAGKLAISLNGHSNYVRQIVRLSHSIISSCSDDKSIRIWDLKLMTQLQVLNGHAYYVRGLLALEHSKIISVSVDSTLRLWTSSGK